MWQRFTEKARKVVFFAQEEAGLLGENYVSTEHLLLGITRTPDNIGALILEALGAKLATVRIVVEARITRSEDKPKQDMQLTPRAKKVIDFAYDEAKRLKNNYIGTEHLLLGLILERDGLAGQVLTEMGVTLEGAREQLKFVQNRGETKPFDGLKPEELVTLDEAVKFLGTSKPTLYRLLGQDEIKGLKVGRQWRFRKADLIAYMERSPVAFAAAPPEDLDRELASFAGKLRQSEIDFSGDAEARTVQLAHQIIRLAIASRASDIHLEPTAEDFLLRYRVDGVLQETRRLPLTVRESLTAQFKKMAEMDVNEKRVPQDGRIPVRHEEKDFDLRIASVPSVYGDALTIRVLLRSDALPGLDKLGLTPEELQQVRAFLHQPNGIFFAAGPTGSGKGTLLYSCLLEIAVIEKKTVTVEDPIEHTLPQTTQVQVNKKNGLTYASALRALLRQDPDVILVGETHDLEVASLAAEAALTGHLVLTSLPAFDASAALLSLMNMGLEPYLVTATALGVVAMRLCRRLCDHCKAPVDLSREPTLSYVTQLAAEGGYNLPAGAIFYRGQGCPQCRGKGYNGRIPLYEILSMSEPVAEALLRRASAEEITALAVSSGMRTLLADGICKAVAGQTTVEEVLRIVSVSV